ncbi:MAG TPA: rhodanese-like domain-containing protein [Phnomibacter sp.]|nr:rhodanese-like domain-containing protein [Phnomibacter sp.]
MEKEITSDELRAWTAAGKPFFLLDVRESHEREQWNIGGTWIPMDEVMANRNAIPTDIPVVVYCRKGVRSAIVIQRLTLRLGITNLYNLKGGISAWDEAEPA